MQQTFENKTCLITGASTGIGRELALQLAAEGARVALAARNENALEAVAAACRKAGGEALVVPTDVGEREACQKLVDRTLEAFGGLDMLVNNAGFSLVSRFEELRDLEAVDHLMRVNFLGSVYCTYFALPHLKDSRGRLVGVSSLTGKFGVPTRSVYAASKHAMAGFFDSLRIELEDSGVSVTMCYPGFVATDVRKNALGPDGKPRGVSHMDEDAMMTVEECAAHIRKAAARRRREWVMGTKARLGQWVKLIAPGLLDQISRKSVNTRS